MAGANAGLAEGEGAAFRPQPHPPSSVESVALSVMRTTLGGRKAKGSAEAARLGPRYLQQISEAAGSEAAGRLRPQTGEVRIPLPLQSD